MGVIHKELGNLERAVECYEAALIAAPNYNIVQSNMAIALTDLGTKRKLKGNMQVGNNQSICRWFSILHGSLKMESAREHEQSPAQS